MNKSSRYQRIKKLLILFIVLITGQVHAQLYPVSVTTQMHKPYSVRLSQYTTSIQERLTVTLNLLDVNDFNRQVRLKLIVKRNNQVFFTSGQVVTGAPFITLDGGKPNTFTNLDLGAYFRLENLHGISPQMYHQPLPDGLYQFCFEVYDLVSGKRLSQPGGDCDLVYMVLHDPPILNFPRAGDVVSAELPQNIDFNWTPRGIEPSNVEYEFILKELWDTQIDPRAAFQASPPLYQTKTFGDRSFLYNDIAPQLIDGKTYGWQVRAFVSDGIEETALYKNNGYSEIFWFTYLSDCDPPGFILAEAISTSSERITWDPNLDHLSYRVQYRKVDYKEETEKQRARREKRNKRRAEKGKDLIEFDPERVDYEWYEVNSRNPYATIHNLEAGTTYEYRVGGQCHVGSGFSYSDPREFTTPTPEESTYYNCGLPPEVTISNKNPLQSLNENETFTAGDFPVTVTEVTGANGRFSGKGFIRVPYLADTKITVVFNNVQINTEYQLIQGEVETAYDPEWENIESVDEFVEGVADLVNILGFTLDEIIESIKENIEINQQANIFIELMEEVLNDPNNGMTQEQQQNLQDFINDKKKVKEAIKQAKEDFANGKNDEYVKQNLVSNFTPSTTEEELFYDDKEYISKVFQQIRCGYVGGSRELPNDYFDKVGQDFTARFDDYGEITVKLASKPTRLGKVEYASEETTSGGNKKTSHYDVFTLDYGGVVITAKKYNELSHTEDKLEKLQEYLFPDNPNAIYEDYQTVLAQVLNKESFTDDDVKALKSIANCGAMYFSVDDKYSIIKKIADHGFALTEYYEDLILDLIENYSGDLATYSNTFLDKLDGDPELLKELFKGIDNTGAQTFWKGNENNFDRFLKVIYGLWQGSKYANTEGYTYVDELLDNGDLSPRVLTYDGKSWFPNVSYEPTTFNQNGVRIATETIYGRHGNLVYDYFQPVWIVFENGGKGKITKTEVPAIYFAGTAKKDNLEKSLDQIGLTIDVALTLTAFGNVTKLRHLTRLQQIGRITLAGVEISSATADILIRYTDLCEGNEAFCETFQEYNTYLQLGLLGSGLLRAKFTASRAKAKKAYEEHREVLVSKYGADDARIKELDGHFGVVRQANQWMDDAYKKQKDVIEKYKGKTISEAKRNAKGVFGEMATDVYFVEKGYQPLHIRNETLLDSWGETGIDHVFVKNGKYYIVESKYKGYAKLGSTADGKQMSDGWITGSNRLLNAVGDEQLINEILANEYTRVLTEIAQDGGIIFKELDELGNSIGTFTP
ncbi:hypothetical protein OOZ15_19315 [Galbibacter sp. EGI 63066]|uniref:fibronectin type III domain-containing protein n=1 Tax=Galbibacter sp. EGI 63066 TaxID=2993559 RepID=UPI002248D202|nr:fibronectin type III domain-containing protein [Galbibacter sp. EGI 63066]MCX2682108.1 hypothetical protein [Galbibacter sp. EGI 63066]